MRSIGKQQHRRKEIWNLYFWLMLFVLWCFYFSSIQWCITISIQVTPAPPLILEILETLSSLFCSSSVWSLDLMKRDYWSMDMKVSFIILWDKVGSTKLTLDSMDILRMKLCWNQQSWWKDRHSYFSPFNPDLCLDIDISDVVAGIGIKSVTFKLKHDYDGEIYLLIIDKQFDSSRPIK